MPWPQLRRKEPFRRSDHFLAEMAGVIRLQVSHHVCKLGVAKVTAGPPPSSFPLPLGFERKHPTRVPSLIHPLLTSVRSQHRAYLHVLACAC